MIVITLTKVPNSLRGDLTKWCQEIQTGVYVGNVSAKIRDNLWDRIMRDIGNGQATMAYNMNNELGYTFKTTRSDRDVIDYDGIPLMMHLNVPNRAVKHGFSDAAKFHKAKVMSHKRLKVKDKLEKDLSESIVSIDIETTGLDVTKDQIIAIGAAKKDSCFYSLIKTNTIVPKKISDLTGLTSTILLDEGLDFRVALVQLKEFIGSLPIVGYNVRFDEAFLKKGYKDVQEVGLSNKIVDLMPVVKKTNKFLDNYRLKTVLEDYKISNQHPHRADSDAKATLELATQLIKKQCLKI
ncbi:type I-E CRISPR-associated endoribonuclease Cas2e [Liquorilactobacillus capillatus]|uniref:DNA polymerase III polC-type n=1 Tax=Liquorilactobacillus capillatus DSM 19910 TaxID=1423731 RepID=A0A0R1MAM6_9LACO|nr:type I-E CRISPR-associated endoribonuclease Cas2e [Liquorilactobacillus capillatus]KRL00520.1 3-5 exonuclease [Liquorilactobacillus capillatus DSM 19910]